MRKLSKTLLLFCLTIIMSATIITQAFAQTLLTQPYIIDSYDVEIVVNENNTYNITETIDVNFNEYRHGIIRVIPLENNIRRMDGSTSTNSATVSDLTVSERYTTRKTEQKEYEIQIGSENIEILGPHEYTISYIYDIGVDPLKGMDELYFNIIGTHWDAPINNVSFKIVMPKEFDESKIDFSVGIVTSVKDDGIEYSVDGNTIAGTYDGTLFHEALTIRCELPEGYFTRTQEKHINPLNPNILRFLLIPFASLLISFAIWLSVKFGRREYDSVADDTSDIGKKMNSLDAGFYYKGRANKKDIVSLLAYLASKGYIRFIELTPKNDKDNSIDFVIEKIRDYDGLNKYEKQIMDGLFVYGQKMDYVLKTISWERGFENQTPGKESVFCTDVDDDATLVLSEEIKDYFADTVDDISIDINRQSNKISELPPAAKCFTPLLLAIASTLIVISLLKRTLPDIEISIGILSTIFPICGLFPMFINKTGDARQDSMSFVVAAIFFLMFCVSVPMLMVLYCMDGEHTHSFVYLISIACELIMAMLSFTMSRKTEYGRKMKKASNNLRKTLLNKKKENRMAFSEDDGGSDYYYDMLPFAYALGISDKWSKKFESSVTDYPAWYAGNKKFNNKRFEKQFSNIMNTIVATRAYHASQQDRRLMYEDSGSSSSGGFSGGGSGGGGGRSW